MSKFTRSKPRPRRPKLGAVVQLVAITYLWRMTEKQLQLAEEQLQLRKEKNHVTRNQKG